MTYSTTFETFKGKHTFILSMPPYQLPHEICFFFIWYVWWIILKLLSTFDFLVSLKTSSFLELLYFSILISYVVRISCNSSFVESPYWICPLEPILLSWNEVARLSLFFAQLTLLRWFLLIPLWNSQLRQLGESRLQYLPLISCALFQTALSRFSTYPFKIFISLIDTL